MTNDIKQEDGIQVEEVAVKDGIVVKGFKLFKNLIVSDKKNW